MSHGKLQPAVLFIIGVLLSIAAFVPASKLKLEESVESFYAPDNPYLLDYIESKKTFGGDEFVFVAYTDPELLEPEGPFGESHIMADQVHTPAFSR